MTDQLTTLRAEVERLRDEMRDQARGVRVPAGSMIGALCYQNVLNLIDKQREGQNADH